jgi:heat-inducible transcriptional repressor
MSRPLVPGNPDRQDPELSTRQREVLVALVAMHGASARAVSSDALSHVGGVRGSAAGIRHVLAELEELGLLTRGHASSGRVPTETGYAWHIRNQLEPVALPDEALREVDRRLRRSAHDVEELLHEASRLLSALTLQLGLALASSLEHERLIDLELAAVEPQRALLVLTLSGGTVRTLKLELAHALDPAELAEVESLLRERLTGLSLAEVRARLAADPELVRDTAVRLVTRAAMASWAEPGPQALFTSGAARIAAQPEFRDGTMLGSLLQVIENGPPLDRLMVGGIEGHPAVRVSLDEADALTRCSLVSYPLTGAPRLAVGVLGPLRMDYARALAAVEAVGVRIASYL